jgi:hypothetical protein
MINNFNQRRLMAILFSLAGWILGWYALILITDKVPSDGPPSLFSKPNTMQCWGLFAAITIGLATWLRNCLTINVSYNDKPLTRSESSPNNLDTL